MSAATGEVTSVRAMSRTVIISVADRLLFGALLLVLASSPFEAGYPPIGRFLFATYTNLEITLFLLGAAWALKLAVDPAARRRALGLPLLLPVAALVGAAVLSTVFGEYRGQGPQYIYRLLMGVLVYAAVWEALRGKRRLIFALATVVAAGGVAALAGLLEFAPWPNMQPWLMAFKPQPTTVGGLLRLSGTFEYANGAAAYFEMALPVTLGLLALFSSRRLLAEIFGENGLSERKRRAGQGVLLTLVTIYTAALVLTLSRAAWAGIIFALGAFALFTLLRRRSPESGRPLLAAMAVMALGAALAVAFQPLLWLRLTGENDRNWYKHTLVEAGAAPPLTAGEVVTVPITLRNDGPMTWYAERVPTVNLSYHWRSSDKKNYPVFEGVRTSLPRDLRPGESVTVRARLTPPRKEGQYYLEWDLVQENVTWFSVKTGVTREAALYSVGALRAGQPQPRASDMPKPVSAQSFEAADTSTVERGKLWRTAFAMFRAQPLTGVGPDGFRKLYGKYAGVETWNENIYTNSLYVEMFTNLGLLGGLAFLWLGGLALWRGLRNGLREPAGALWTVCLGATASLVTFFQHGFVDYFLFSTPIYVLFWFLLAVVALWPRLGRHGENKGEVA